jgi:hypothetical protein
MSADATSGRDDAGTREKFVEYRRTRDRALRNELVESAS